MENIKNYLSANLRRFVERKSLAALILSHEGFEKAVHKPPINAVLVRKVISCKRVYLLERL